MAVMHNNSVYRDKGDGTKEMSGDALLQAIQIFAVNKHEQGVGECLTRAVSYMPVPWRGRWNRVVHFLRRFRCPIIHVAVV